MNDAKAEQPAILHGVDSTESEPEATFWRKRLPTFDGAGLLALGYARRWIFSVSGFRIPRVEKGRVDFLVLPSRAVQAPRS